MCQLRSGRGEAILPGLAEQAHHSEDELITVLAGINRLIRLGARMS